MSPSTTNFKKYFQSTKKQLLKKHQKGSTVEPINRKNNISDLPKNIFYKNTKKRLRSSPITKKIVLHPLLRHLLPLKNAQKGLRCASVYPPYIPHHPPPPPKRATVRHTPLLFSCATPPLLFAHTFVNSKNGLRLMLFAPPLSYPPSFPALAKKHYG